MIPSHEQSPLVFTCERFIPGAPVGVDTAQEHILRYQACATLATGKAVLDAACGEGYGSDLLARSASQVTGIDLSEATIQQARKTYASRTNLRFYCGSVTQLPYPDETFDLVVSFETIEHLTATDQIKFINEIHRVLKPDGLFVISTPNRINYSDRACHINPYHLHELTPDEFVRLLGRFQIHRIYSQSTMAFSCLWSPDSPSYNFHGKLTADDCDDIFTIIVGGRERSQAPDSNLASLSYDPALSYNRLRLILIEKEIYIEKLSKWGQQVEAESAIRSNRINELQSEIQKLGIWGKSLDQEIMSMRQRHEHLVKELLDEENAHQRTRQKAHDLEDDLGKNQALLADNQAVLADAMARHARIARRVKLLPKFLKKKLLK
jgi:ubiquinone/menaquinone biosynthesis C-methylase UbiE